MHFRLLANEEDTLRDVEIVISKSAPFYGAVIRNMISFFSHNLTHKTQRDFESRDSRFNNKQINNKMKKIQQELFLHLQYLD